MAFDFQPVTLPTFFEELVARLHDVFGHLHVFAPWGDDGLRLLDGVPADDRAQKCMTSLLEKQLTGPSYASPQVRPARPMSAMRRVFRLAWLPASSRHVVGFLRRQIPYAQVASYRLDDGFGLR